MRLRHYNSLRNFVVAAQFPNLAAASEELCLTKGALSQQIKGLEEELGFRLFVRSSRGIELTEKGRILLNSCQTGFAQIEHQAKVLRSGPDDTLTIGTTTYFASRWLSPRLMNFIRLHPKVKLLIQPTIETGDLEANDVDLAIRWGTGGWTDHPTEKLLACPAWPTGDAQAFDTVERFGLEEAFGRFTLLRDHPESDAWSAWYEAAGLSSGERADTLIIRDPNVRVQAVLDGQGVALNDALVKTEMDQRRLFRLSEVELPDFGYHLVFRKDRQDKEAVQSFVEWVRSEART